MNASLGTAGVALGLTAALLGAITMMVGLLKRRVELVRFGPIAAIGVAAGAVLSFAAMERALITRDFSLKYVTEVGSRGTPRLFNFAALWSALEGSILLWSLILAGYTIAVVVKFRHRLTDPLVGWALVTMLGVCAFFFILMAGPANPFKLVSGQIPTDGPGPNALLQNHPLMLFHPPILYLGYVGFTVPFAFAIGALATGRLGEGWLLDIRRWTLYAWAFLTVGIVLGSWWAYEVLGWGGFWGWDPVENASFLPWLTGTAYLHSVLVQERRGMLRVWNLSLVCATFSLTILGTFLTRSGVIQSVHAFSQSSIGPFLLTFFGIVVAVSLILIGWRGDRLRSPGTIDSPVSREGAFLLNNLLFAAFAFVVLLGTVFPLLVEALQDRRISVGKPFFDQMAMPLGLCLLTLMALAPVLPWRKASGELLRHRLFWPAWCGTAALVLAVLLGGDGLASLVAFFLAGFAAGSALRQLVIATRRQGWRGFIGRANGGMIVHIGVIVIAVAITAMGSYSRFAVVTLQPGETRHVLGHDITYVESREDEDSAKLASKAIVKLDGAKTLAPAVQRFQDGTLVNVPSVQTRWNGDVYLTLETTATAADRAATIGVRTFPLAMWLWAGGGIMAIGTILSAFPGKRRRRPTDAVSAPIPVEEPALAGV